MFKVTNRNKNDRKILMESHCCFQYQIQSNSVLIMKYYVIWVLRLVCRFWRTGREDSCGVKNKCWENSECLCLHYYVLFTLFWQFMTLYLLQTVPTFMMTVKKNCNICQGNIHSDCSSLLTFIFRRFPGAKC